MGQKNKRDQMPEQPAGAVSSSTSFLLGWLSVAWAAFVIGLYWNRFSWFANPPLTLPLSAAPIQWSVFLLDLKALFLAATTLLGSAALGSHLLRRFKLPWISPLEEKIFAVGLGLGSLGFLVFA